ncbi:MAG: addiction module protein [Spirochaetes bacterium]|jgi:putative addiction module component (TIGR02574 family)|nr:addiction module protein [Spirochaetota bacterium]
MNTRDLIDEAYSLPVEERVRLVESLLESLNKPETALDEKWAAVARSRLQQLRNGSVEATPGKEVFEKAWHRFHE